MNRMRKAHPRHPITQWLARPVIPVIWNTQADLQVLSEASTLFVQGCELADLGSILAWLKAGAVASTPVWVHVDLLAGLSSDEAGLRYLAELGKIDGIITVRSHVVGAARRLGLASMLLLFLQDGRSVQRGLHIVEQSKPDAIELVPGVAALETAEHFAQLGIPRVAGGLVRTPQLVQQLCGAGFASVSSSNSDLWRLNRAAGERKPAR